MEMTDDDLRASLIWHCKAIEANAYTRDVENLGDERGGAGKQLLRLAEIITEVRRRSGVANV